MRRIYLSVTASAVLLTACTTQQEDATPQDSLTPQEQIEQEKNGQLNLQQIHQGQSQQPNKSPKQGTSIDVEEHFLEDISKYYDNEKLVNDDIDLFIDGMHLHTKPSAFIDGDEVYIPLSFISTHLEAGVRYNQESNKVEIRRGDSDIELFIDNDTATVNGEGVDTPTFIKKEENIFVPICFVAEALGYSVYKEIEEDKVQIETHRPEVETFQFTAMEVNEYDSVESIPVQAMKESTYTVKAGDSLSVIAKKFNMTVERLKELNGLSTEVIKVGQELTVFNRPESYTVTSGDTLFSIARKFELTVEQIQRYNNLTSNVIQPGQVLSLTQPTSYTVKSGDSLYSIAKSFGTTVEKLREWNNLPNDSIHLGQILKVNEQQNTPKLEEPSNEQTYKVQAGDSLYSIAKRFQTTVGNLQRWNNLSDNVIQVGQTLFVTSQGVADQPSPTINQTYKVQAGDNLITIAKRFNTTVENLKRWNNLTSDVIQVGQTLMITGERSSVTPSPSPINQSSYTVKAGDNLISIAKQFNTTVEQLKQWNKLTNDTIRIGQTLSVDGDTKVETKGPTNSQQTTYTVVRGDTLLGIAKRFNTTVNDIKRWNNMRYDDLRIGRTLIVAGSDNGDTNQQGVTVSFKTHTVVSGDNLWKLSIKYGIPMLELAKENNLSINSALSIGQKLTVPVYHVPVKETVSANHGELLDWWTEARYVFPVGSEATVKDVRTGKTFKVKHTTGGNHADSEPLTATDANVMKEVWGGSYSWTPRAIIVNVNGRKLAAAMHSYPHSTSDIKNNNYNGHFCIHFLNSTRHKDGLIQDSMQKQIRISAGVQ